MSIMFDVSFGTDGIVTTDFNNTNDQNTCLYIQSTGKIILAGSRTTYNDTDFAMVRYNTDGTVDNLFGSNGDGRVITNINNKANFAYSMIILDNDDIILCGKTGTDITLVKYNSNGIIDTTFGSSGKVITTISTTDIYSNSIAVQNNKIILAGYIFTNSYSRILFFIMRYTLNGIIDTTFGGGNGYVTHSFGGSNKNRGFNLFIQKDYKIIICGSTIVNSLNNLALLRLNPDGSLDASFGINGSVITDISTQETFYSVVVQSDDKIIATGNSINTNYNNDFCLVRYLPNGSIDTSFGNNGIVLTDMNGNEDVVNCIALQSDNKIVISGTSYDRVTRSIVLLRYTENGILDKTFGYRGIIKTSINNRDSYNYGLKIQTDEKILISGYYLSSSTNNDFVVMRFNKEKPSILERKNLGATVQDLLNDGYEKSEIVTLGYLPIEYATNGFTPNELYPYFSIRTIMLESSGFTPELLKQYGIIDQGIVYFHYTIILQDFTYTINEVCFNVINEVVHYFKTINNGVLVSEYAFSYTIE
jgi:uncharacterized delta-60 repeat protein